MRDTIRRTITGPGLILIGLIVGYQGYEAGKLASQLKKDGSVVKGKVLEHETRRGRKGGVTYYLLAEYNPEKGPLTQKLEVSNDFYTAHNDGDEIEIRYLRSEPKTAHVEGQHDGGRKQLLGGGLMVAVGLIVTYFLLVRPWLSEK